MASRLSYRLDPRRRRFWRGSATLVGIIVLTALAGAFLAAWSQERNALLSAEADRERGRVWGMTCAATQRAVQSRPASFTTPRAVTPAQLKAWSLIPDGLRGADEIAGLEARYGAILVDGVPLAACSLSGSEIGVRYPSLREGAVMGGLESIEFVGGDATAMHGRLGDVTAAAVLGALPNGSMFMTADFGIGHPAERAHRRAVGGRPELSSVEQRVRFQGGAGVLGAGVVSSERADADGGSLGRPGLPGRAETTGDVVVGGLGTLTATAATDFEAVDGGFAFGGGTQTVWAIRGEMAVGTSMRSRGAADALNLRVTGQLAAGGGLDARTSAGAVSLTIGNEVSAIAGTVTGNLVVSSCSGCDQPVLGGP